MRKRMMPTTLVAVVTVVLVVIASTARRSETMRLASERDGLFRRLGQTVYAGGDGTDERAAIDELDARIAALEQEANEIAARATERVDAARLEVQPTEVRPPGAD